MSTRRTALVLGALIVTLALVTTLVLQVGSSTAGADASGAGLRGGPVPRPVMSVVPASNGSSRASDPSESLLLTELEVVGRLADLAQLIMPDEGLPEGCALDSAVKPNPLFLQEKVAAVMFTSIELDHDVTAWDIVEAQLVMYRERAKLGIFAYRFSDEFAARHAAVRLLGTRGRRENNRIFLAHDAVVWLWDDGVSEAVAAAFDQLVRSAFADA